MAKKTSSDDDRLEIPSAADVKDSDKSSRWLVISAVLIAVVVIVGVIFLFIARGLNADEHEQAQKSPHTAQDSSQPIPDGDEAPSEGTDISDRFEDPTTDNQGTRLEVPKDRRGQLLPRTRGADEDSFDGLQWQKVLGLAMPFSTAAGPSTMTGLGTPGGFARSEQGAALAAWQLQWRLMLGSNALRSEILDTSVVHEEGFRDQQRQVYLSMPQEFADTDVFNTIPVYLKVDTYDGDVATISFGALNSAGSEAGMVTTMTVLWRDGGWKLFLRGPVGEMPARDIDSFEGWGKW